LKNDRHCFSLRDNKICLFDIETSKLLSVIAQENEEVLCFAVSPNQHFLAVSNKNYLIRVFALPEQLETIGMTPNLEQVK
jgi:WD40 repeat protein